MEVPLSVTPIISPEKADATVTGHDLTGISASFITISMEHQEREAINNMLSIAAEGVVVEGSTKPKSQGKEPSP